MFKEYEQYDGLALAELIRQKEITSADVLDAMRSRVETHNPSLNAIVEIYEDELAKTPVDGAAFSGLPMLVKDLNLYVKGQVTANGSRLMKDQVADRDSALVENYRKAGMLIAGRTNSPEFGLSASTEPLLNGPTHSPWQHGISSGGSSGGASAAVAAGIVPFAHASDGGGSIRIPASACGLFGLKPSRGRISSAPHAGEGWNGLSSHHAVSRTVRDNAALLDISHGYVAGDPYAAPAVTSTFLDACKREPGKLRIAFNFENPVGLPMDPACVEAVKQTAALCESLGHVVEEARPDYDPIDFSMTNFTIIGAHALVTVKEHEEKLGRAARDDELEDITRKMIAGAREQSAEDYVRAQRNMHRISRQLAVFWQQYDMYLTPVLGTPPQAHGDLLFIDGGDYEAYGIKMATYSPFASLANFTGQPAMSVPLHWTDDNLPVGLMFTGAYGDEAKLYSLAAQLEQAKPWFDRRP